MFAEVMGDAVKLEVASNLRPVQCCGDHLFSTVGPHFPRTLVTFRLEQHYIMLSREVVYMYLYHPVLLQQNIHYSSLTQSAAARLKQLKGLRILTTMEEIHMAAIAYYHNASCELQELAWSFFRSMDLNGDRQISFGELALFFRHWDYYSIRNLFISLDQNRDGVLDFWEVLTLYYIMKTRVHCIQCRGCLMGQYFTCVECFDSGGDTYDLCVRCYSGRSYQHHHHSFLDSYLLLRSMRGLAAGGTNLNQALVHQPVPDPPVDRPWHYIFQLDKRILQLQYFWNAFTALEVALGAANLFASCTIM
ncbi:hypothetical protein CJ030_MR3G001154 [Morella rubra]|uniref:EF-hand domain-containing protein n=1 Tax=Morella rubra TaxID=262757 RepID=A0A6A1W396_9ROSI|nr:hypothetical protein CJ030_MR3G001154 [Morella rubra]